MIARVLIVAVLAFLTTTSAFQHGSHNLLLAGLLVVGIAGTGWVFRRATSRQPQPRQRQRQRRRGQAFEYAPPSRGRH